MINLYHIYDKVNAKFKISQKQMKRNGLKVDRNQYLHQTKLFQVKHNLLLLLFFMPLEETNEDIYL